MQAQVPLPSFEDIRKILQFWIDQQDKWFYFEAGLIQSGVRGEAQAPNPVHNLGLYTMTTTNQMNQYLQTRVVGKIKDVVSYPPSLLLGDTHVFTVRLSYDWDQRTQIVSKEERDQYGLVFSQISYYEPVADIKAFIAADPRVVDTEAD